jgi:hypothetical protein
MRRAAIVLALLVTAGSTATRADDRIAPVSDPTVRRECGSCHMAFPPGLLPARSWSRLVEDRGDHFGEDLALPAATAELIAGYLVANAGDTASRGLARKYMRWIGPDGTPLRITENPAFLRKHPFPGSTWRDPKVVTKSNCLACHADAAQGAFEAAKRP